MIKLSDTLKLIGGLFLMFSMIVTFKFDALDKIYYITDAGDKLSIDDIIYFRGVLIGSILIISGSAITTVNHTVQNIMIALCLGLFSLLVVSTHNLIYDYKTDLDYYFDLTMLFTFIGLIAIILIRLWSRRYFLKKR